MFVVNIALMGGDHCVKCAMNCMWLKCLLIILCYTVVVVKVTTNGDPHK